VRSTACPRKSSSPSSASKPNTAATPAASACFEALATLAFKYPPRAEFFRTELEQFLLLARENNLDPLAVKGSFAGAIGIPQFMPGSQRRYAVDFDGDQRVDLSNSVDDAIGSVARFLEQHGWQAGQPVAVPADQWRTGPPMRCCRPASAPA
jgi:membrane-bound lytic murein transglycosylase B